MVSVAHDHSKLTSNSPSHSDAKKWRRTSHTPDGANAVNKADDSHLKAGGIKRVWSSMICGLVIALLCTAFLTYLQRWCKTDSGVSQDTPAFTVVSLPGKGMGMVASRDILPGELIIRERPLFTVPTTTNGSPENLIASRLSILPEIQRMAFYNLSYFIPGPDTRKKQLSKEQLALAIFQTNAISAGDGVGIFPTVARLNHGCSSAFNSVYSWRASEGLLVVHALKHIKRGMELLTTYTDTKRRRAERRSYLKENYGFDCFCSVCSLPDSEARESDERLVKMANLYKMLATWSASHDGRTAVDVARKILKVGDEEGYISERGRLAADIVHVAAAHSDIQATSSWASLASEWFARELGRDSDQVQLVDKYARYPQEHPAWGTQHELVLE